MPLLWISLSYFKPYYFERFLEKFWSVHDLLHLERKIIYLSRTYVKFILLAYSVFSTLNEGKRTCPNSDLDSQSLLRWCKFDNGLEIKKKNITNTERSRKRDSRYHSSANKYLIELNVHLLVADGIERLFGDYFITIWPAAGQIVTPITILSHTDVDIQFPPLQICSYRFPLVGYIW